MKEFILYFKGISAFLRSDRNQFHESDVFVVRHDADCGYQYNGKAYSPIVDSIVEVCFAERLSVLSLATPFSRLIGAQAFNSPVLLNRPFLWIALLSRLLAPLIGGARSKEWAASRKTKLWLRVLDQVKPRLVIGIQPDVYLCRACRIQNVQVYDVQHGVIAPGHWWYGNKLKNDVPASDLPSGFLCWDEKSAEALAAWAPARGCSVSVVGNPWFQRFQYPADDDRLVQDALQRKRINFNEKPTVLVSLQWGLHIHYYQDSDFNKIMCKALETAIKRTHTKYNWLLRLHPVQLRGEEERYCSNYLSSEFGNYSGVEWDHASRLPLPVVLAQVDLHITDMSTVVTEAGWLGVPSALLNPHLNRGGKLESLYENERRLGLASVLPQEVDAIETWMEEKLESGVKNSRPDIPREGIRSLLKKTMVTNG